MGSAPSALSAASALRPRDRALNGEAERAGDPDAETVTSAGAMVVATTLVADPDLVGEGEKLGRVSGSAGMDCGPGRN